MGVNKKILNIIKPVPLIFICLFLGLIFIPTGNKNIALAESDETAVTEDAGNLDVIIINNGDYKKDRRGPCTFAHRKHAKEYKISCWECHHDYVDGNNTWSPWGTTERCSACHDANEKIDNIMKLQTAYHTNCKKCHEERAIYGNDARAYRKCNTCHDNLK